MKILLADDDVVFARTLKHLIGELGHEIILTHQGEEAWEAYQRDPANIIISDWVMPGIDGLEFCRKVRATNRREYTYFILLTGNVGKTEYARAMDTGVDDFLGKPVDGYELCMRVHVAERILKSTRRIHHLETLLPICSYCKRIRNPDRSWTQLESYLSQKMDTDVSHGVCPECMKSQVDPQLRSL